MFVDRIEIDGFGFFANRLQKRDRRRNQSSGHKQTYSPIVPRRL
jgi:hypothetical protein